MEEKGKKTRMQVLKPRKEEKKEQQKLSYEELNKLCSQLYQENQYLRKQLDQANLGNMFKRLDYLFRAVECEAVIKDPAFIGECVEEIKDALIIKEEAKEAVEE